MKKSSILFILLSIAFNARAIDVTVNENVEFVSAVARLAEFEEYINNVNEEYAYEIDSIFAPYKDHPAVDYLRRVRNKQGVSFDAVSLLAIHTTIENGKFVYLDGAEISDADNRWLPGQGAELALLLNDLYHQVDFNRFFTSKRPFYEMAIANMNKLLADTDITWLETFFGKPLLRSHVIISLLNVGNYGLTRIITGNLDEAFIIVGCYKLDDNNMPVFHGMERLIVHESSHTVTNPLIDANFEKFNSNCMIAAELMEKELAEQYYSGALTMLCESMVRAAELQYKLAHAKNAEDTTAVNIAIRDQMSMGYIFQPEIMAAYDANRGKPVDDMMPALINSINSVDVQSRYAEIVNSRPKLLGCSIEEGSTGVSPSDSLEIRFFFDRPIGNSFGMNYLDGREDIMPRLADVQNRIALDSSRCVLSVKVVAEPDKEYGFILPGVFFRGDKGYRGHGSARVHFFTGK